MCLLGERVQEALWTKKGLGSGTLEQGHGAPFESLAKLGDALDGVDAIAATIDAAELVARQTAQSVGSVSGR